PPKLCLVGCLQLTRHVSLSNTQNILGAATLPQPHLPFPQGFNASVEIQEMRLLHQEPIPTPYPTVYMPSLQTILQ
ncbi:MAG: hypothetical protein KOO63_10790, partial [Bacteroidales bacterium]|nr:hypothetical protein [Candidatus Latescibacterota bacterium]